MQKIVFGLLLIGNLFAFGQSPVRIKAADFKRVFGAWKGELTYRDYSTGNPFTMPADIEISGIQKTNQLLFVHQYPDEPEANETDTVTIAAKGTLLDGENIVSKRKLAGGNLEIVTEIHGVDGNDDKPARMRHTYTLGRNVYVVRKDVLFDGETEWIMRHEFRYEKRMR